jgi:hypothetical protein
MLNRRTFIKISAAVSSLAGTAALAKKKKPQKVEVEGTITELSSSEITIEDDDGEETTFELLRKGNKLKTKVMVKIGEDRPKKGNEDDLDTDFNAIVEGLLYQDGTLTATEITLLIPDYYY